MVRTLLYFGSFNPIHKGHIALAEYAIAEDLADEVILIVSPRNPLKADSELAAEIERFTMAEVGCAASRYPEQIKPSLVEFLLERPSYTINTLRYLSENYGDRSHFSILMGGDLVGQLRQWRDYEQILDGYNIYVYPRPDEQINDHLDKITILTGAPEMKISSSEIRRRLLAGESCEGILQTEVEQHIHKQRLWSKTIE